MKNRYLSCCLPGFLELTLDTGAWAPGVYLLRLRANEKSWTQKVVKR
jgi:hypothetical protein